MSKSWSEVTTGRNCDICEEIITEGGGAPVRGKHLEIIGLNQEKASFVCSKCAEVIVEREGN
ncbi:MAG: hypothetical protein ABEK59_09635 [Halobacteria archaeon]